MDVKSGFVLATIVTRASEHDSKYLPYLTIASCHTEEMIEKVVRKGSLRDFSEVKENLSYWMSKTPEERVAAVDYLRKKHHGSTGRLQRSARVVQQS